MKNLGEAMIEEMLKLRDEGLSSSQIARKLGLTKGQVIGRLYRHNDCKGTGLKPNKFNSKLHADDVRHIKFLLAYNIRQNKIAKMYSVSPNTIWMIKNNITWKNI